MTTRRAALLSLALHGSERPTSVKEIAERTRLPQPYLEQILLVGEGRRPRALEARRRRRVRARPAAGRDHPRRDRRARSRVRSSRSRSIPTTARATASCRRCGSCVSDETRRVPRAGHARRPRPAHARRPLRRRDLNARRRRFSLRGPAREDRRQLRRQRLGEREPRAGRGMRRTRGARRGGTGGRGRSTRGDRRTSRRRRRDGRSRRDARGSDGCARSRACTRAGCTAARRRCARLRSRCAAGLPASRTAMRVRRAVERPIGASIDAARRRRPPPHERDVAPVDRARRELLDERVVRARGAGHDHQAARVAVEAVHDARAASDRRRPRSRDSARAVRCTSVPEEWPAPGCTTSPAGLATTMTSSSS